MTWIDAGPAQVLCGFKSSIYCLRGGEAIRSADSARVPSLAGPSQVHFTLRGSHTPFGFLKFY